MKKSFLLFSIMVLFLVSCTSKSTDKVSSSIHFEEGFTQTLVFGTETSANKLGGFEDANEVYFRLDEITSDSTYVFTGKVMRMRYASDLYGEKESLDTKEVATFNTTRRLSKTELTLYNDIKGYIDTEFTVILDTYGNIIQRAKFKDSSTFLDPTIVAQYTPVPTFGFPKEKLAVGTTWNYDTRNPIIDSQEMKFTYTIDAITEDKIFIKVELAIDGLSGLFKSNKAIGMYEIDRKTKQFIKGERTMNIQAGGGKATYKIYEQ